MTPQERQLVDDLFDRLSRVENAPRDPDAAAAISEGLRKAPNAIYALVQTALVQDEALRRANGRIHELEAAQAGEQHQSGGFLDSMREAVFGQGNQPHGSVPNVPPPQPQSHPVWNSGQVMQQAGGPAQYGAGSYGQSYGSPPFGGGGGSFLGTAAAAAAGMVGGSLLLNGIRSMMGGSRYGFADSGTVDRAASPWSDQSGSTLAKDAGIGDIGSSSDSSDQSSRAGLFDAASDDQSTNYDDQDQGDYQDGDQDAMDLDSDDFGDDGGSDYA